ncbi:MAG: histidine--tRNA ligase [Chitinophagaceae bacterium]
MKPSIPQGTRDFGAEVVMKRRFIFNSIISIFELYGFEPLETPAFENLETLMGKYGEEGDRLIFKILNNGLDNPSKKENSISAFNKILEGKSSKDLTERALKYDLTIPFARYVAMNHGKLNLPFKRYQLQPVWRADRPQKGRYREFYQCDADIAGSSSLLHDAELAQIYIQAFTKLRIPVKVKINSRKILQALAMSACGSGDQLVTITTAIDKLDKIGLEKILEELKQKNLSAAALDIIKKFLQIAGSNEEKIDAIKLLLAGSDLTTAGLAEIEYVLAFGENETNSGTLVFDQSLARGLNYYTGIIYEVTANNVEMGSIGGGGRYDDLTGLFGVKNVPGVGISFGIDRIYDVMEESGLFPDAIHAGTKVLFFNLGQAESEFAFRRMQELRAAGIACELYHETAKLEKQFKYAEKKQVQFVIIIGSREIENNHCLIKNMNTGLQETKGFADIRHTVR